MSLLILQVNWNLDCPPPSEKGDMDMGFDDGFVDDEGMGEFGLQLE